MYGVLVLPLLWWGHVTAVAVRYNGPLLSSALFLTVVLLYGGVLAIALHLWQVHSASNFSYSRGSRFASGFS
ncbi:hypothetical protein FIBSPDRAFT_57615 [Athelia psychrophila]|uniref:Uncharacterized protein n=1 Tax=Athelia psychrophila TaxID=1759441 RepID=A0A166FCH9_9AGAM|nr:hypothetical protein FIBSPDRAFT_57615 [Fibularhizoctonia sp. CBS 109695]